MYDDQTSHSGSTKSTPWNKNRIIGPKPPLKPQEIWAIRTRLQLANKVRDLALFNLAIDSKLRGCDLVKLKVRDIAHSGKVVPRASIVQQKTGQPVKFELTEHTRKTVEPGSPRRSSLQASFCSQAVSAVLRILRNANMHAC